MGKRNFSDEERQSFYAAILHLDPDNEFVITDKDSDTLAYTSLINSEEKISGRPGDEELTRSLILLHLIKTYGYKPEQIQIENTFAIGGRRVEGARAVETDIVLKNADGEIEVVCEVKRIHDYSGVDDSSIKNQLFTPFSNLIIYNSAKYLFYLSVDVPLNKEQFPLNCIGIDTSITKTYEEWTKQGRTPHLVDIVQPNEKPVVQNIFVKLSGDEENLSKQIKDLNENFSIDLLRRHWRTLWDFIWSGTLEDNKKFENFNKVLLAKVYDERKTKQGTPYVFQRKFKSGVPQSETDLASDVDLLYRRAYREYLSKDKEIELRDVNGIDFKEFPPYLICKCVELLCAISFQKNRYKNVDVLGEFYEMVIRDAFKQTKGLFLTHPNIVLFLLSALEIDELVVDRLRHPDQDARYRLPFVIDPSCGTGTFLIHYMQFVQKLVNENYSSIAQGDDDVTEFIKRQMLGDSAFKWVIDYVYGIDNEQVLATACQINMILHGDGSTNVYGADGLDSFANYAQMDVTGGTNILSSKLHDGKSYYSKNTIDRFDVVISNPPFNVNVNSAAVQPNFEIKGKSEAYFLERWYQLLKPGGRLGVVLPESFFAVEDDVNGRIFLYKHFNIKAIISIPNFAFSPHTTTSTSLLLASKKTVREETEFQDAWSRTENVFDERYSRFNAMLSAPTASLSFEIEDEDTDKSIKTLLHKATEFLDKEFGHGFVILPYFTDSFLFNAGNYGVFKKKVRAVAASVKERWILHQVTASAQGKFYNLAVANVGYKAGKKGSKDKPNELMAIYDDNGNRIYNLKYSHAWHRVDIEDMETALGILKELKLWQ